MNPPDDEPPAQQGYRLITLPDEIQQAIYRHVYPINDITLLPDNHPSFVPRTLTQEFNVLGSHDTALLQTCSKICAVAKPIRDTSFTGRVNVSRVKDLGHCGYWISHNLRTICLVPQELNVGFKLHLSYFPNLRRLLIVHCDVNELSPVASEGSEDAAAFLNHDVRDEIYLDAAKALKGSFFSPTVRVTRARREQPDAVTIDHPHLLEKVELLVYLRYTVAGWDTPTDKHTLGVTVKITSKTQQITAKVLRNENRFSYWETDPSGDCDGRPVGSKRPYVHGENAVVAVRRDVVTKTLRDVPRRLGWVRHDGEGVEFADLP